MGSTISKGDTFKAAGCIFTNKIHILAGYQPNKKTPYISGFGGARQANESFVETALRETIEELLDIKDVPYNLIDTIQHTIIPDYVINNKQYVTLVYSFDQLIEILVAAHCFIDHLEIYRKFPTNLDGLIIDRIIRPSAEITHLCLLPVSKNLILDPLFVEDINNIYK